MLDSRWVLRIDLGATNLLNTKNCNCKKKQGPAWLKNEQNLKYGKLVEWNHSAGCILVKIWSDDWISHTCPRKWPGGTAIFWVLMNTISICLCLNEFSWYTKKIWTNLSNSGQATGFIPGIEVGSCNLEKKSQTTVVREILGRNGFTTELSWSKKWSISCWVELSWVELSWVELSWVELSWVELSWVDVLKSD